GPRITYASPGHEKIYGRPVEDFYAIPTLWKDVIHPEDGGGSIEREVNAQLAESGFANIQYRIFRPNGEVRWISSHLKAVFGPDGAPTGLDGQTKDITDKKAASDALKASEHRFQRTISNIPGVVYQFKLDPDGTQSFPYMSSRCLEIFGVEASEVVRDANVLMSRVNEEDLRALPAVMAASAASMAEFRWDCRLRTSGGQESWFRVVSRPEAMPDGSTIWDGMILDITTEKSAEILIREKEAAERANREKSLFLSRMSHELRTPLNAILGFGQVLDMKLADADSREMATHIVKSGRHLLDLINEVLDISRIESGTIQVSCEPVDFYGMSGEVLDILAPLCARREIHAAVEGGKPESLFVLADPQRLRQVLLNLVSNAIKYNSVGGTVVISAAEVQSGDVEIRVRDNGPGISDEHKARLFSPFDRLGAEVSHVEGTGLGLALSRNLVSAMGGTIRMEDAEGGGCVFIVGLPKTAQASHNAPSSAEAPEPAERINGLVLYIEDNYSSTRLMSTICDHVGISLHVAGQGRLGFETAQVKKPQLIFLDLDLPDIHGIELLGMLKRNPITKPIPVVVVSADATSARVTSAMEAGAQAYITKPFDVPALVDLLR
ncbi:MAG TPA: ATP-binding protein, partial [Fimbriimonadaceae bacterium]|nr:ATP-binding protein [Fimbriimonadaceae bacterium]